MHNPSAPTVIARLFGYPVLCIVVVWLTTGGQGAAAPPRPDYRPDDALTLAWFRFEEGSEKLNGTPYYWLGRNDIELVVQVRPQAGHVLELLWGSKDDVRVAMVTINGQQRTVRSDGFEGFRWVRVPVPENAKGERYEIILRRGEGKPAFLNEIRLTWKQHTGPQADLTKPTYKCTANIRPRPAEPRQRPPVVEAFPDKRPLWDASAVPAPKPHADAKLEAAFQQAQVNGRRANEMLFRSRKFVEGWLKQADPKTGLIPRNLNGHHYWNAQDAAADNYPFMVLTAALTDRALFDERMLQMLRTETKLTSRIDRLPDTWSFPKQAFLDQHPNLDGIIFGAAEYVKDGLIPLTEWLGPSPWSERMLGIVDDIWKHAPVETPFGRIPTLKFEVNGDLLQACSRLYWFTGERKYLDWAIRLGDYYLLGDQHPTRNLPTLRLVDHGCEVINGLSELYVAVSHAAPAKKKAYQEPLHAIFDRILQVARNEHGLLYASFNPKTGEHSRTLCDTWGYDYDGVYTLWLIDKKQAYRDAVRKVLGNLKPHYTGHNWGGADGYADSIEGAINLYNREPIASVAEWLDSEIRSMWRAQRADGIIEGWHGDGNSARTAIMYALWKSQGFTIQPWREDVRLGVACEGDRLAISLMADKPYCGKLLADKPRHTLVMHLPLDYPRINQFPEWFTAQADRSYTLQDLAAEKPRTLSGQQLLEGVAVQVQPDQELRLLLQ